MIPSNYISRSKTVNETISLFADFTPFFVSGETITEQSVSVIVYSGLDGNPSDLLYLGLTLIKGRILEQRFKKGLPGVIYSVVFTVTTSLANVYEITTRLAVLPNATGALPVFDVLYATSTLYPLIFSDSLSGSPRIISGKLVQSAYYYTESLVGIPSIPSGNLTFHGIIPYYIPHEDLTGSPSIVSGLLVNYPIIPYTYIESLYGTATIISGNMVNYPILTYSYTESLQGVPSITGGTLS